MRNMLFAVADSLVRKAIIGIMKFNFILVEFNFMLAEFNFKIVKFIAIYYDCNFILVFIMNVRLADNV